MMIDVDFYFSNFQFFYSNLFINVASKKRKEKKYFKVIKDK